ncbi:hypothetical protein [Burkholderia perseverans]|uniref:hypothetical protein n=1 Tax=Burkholderia perseverans TaxID=2615214 RepID=UPI001FF018E3|nr:hypothetical protein [Burkholderia perseverans]
MSTPESKYGSTVGAPRIGWTVALSLVFYLIALAAGLDGHPTLRFWHAKSSATTTPHGDTIVGAVRLSPNWLKADEPSDVLIRQAHDCALAGRWDCLSEASDAALALRGTEPDTIATPVEQSATPVWASANLPPSVAPNRARDHAVRVSARTRFLPHHRAQPAVYRLAAQPMPVPRASDAYLAELYRH